MNATKQQLKQNLINLTNVFKTLVVVDEDTLHNPVNGDSNVRVMLVSKDDRLVISVYYQNHGGPVLHRGDISIMQEDREIFDYISDTIWMSEQKGKVASLHSKTDLLASLISEFFKAGKMEIEFEKSNILTIAARGYKFTIEVRDTQWVIKTHEVADESMLDALRSANINRMVDGDDISELRDEVGRISNLFYHLKWLEEKRNNN